MITANVKEAGAAALVNPAPASSARVQSAGGADSFQNILNKQTENTDTAKQTDRETGSEGKPAVEKTDTESRKAPVKDQEKKVGPQKETEEPAEETELPEEIADAAKEAVQQLLFQTAEVFHVTVEELKGLMQEMGIPETGLLDPQQLGSLILEAGGAEGSFELVTNGELYEKFCSLMETRDQLAGEIAAEAGMDQEQLIQRLTAEPEAVPAVKENAAEVIREIPEEQPVEPEEVPVVKENAAEIIREVPQERSQVPEEDTGSTQDQETWTSNTRQAENTQQVEQPRPETNAENTGGEEGRENRQGGSGEERGEISREIHRESPGAYENNPVMRQTTMETAVYEMRTESASQTMDPDTQNIMRQILDYMKVQIRPETTSLEMQLHPANLGTVQIQLASRGGAVTAQFIAENEVVKAALENQMIQLRENFEEQGIRVEAIEVSVQTGRFEQSYEEQERNADERQNSRARSGRRLRLDAQLTPEQLDALTDDERLTADMMAANGGTVDYMA